MTAPAEGYRVPAVVAAVRALDALAGLNGAGASLSELARLIDRSKSTVFNLLSTLESEGLVSRDAATRRYHLGARLIPLGSAAAREARPLAVALERAREIAADTGLSVAVAQTIAGPMAQVVDSVTPPSGLHVGITIGDRYGVFDGAIGKSLLAGMPEPEAERMVRESSPRPHTARTITDADALLADVAEVRRRGWATSLGELNENHAVSACVTGPAGAPLLILAVLGFASQLPGERVTEVGERLCALTESVSIETGGVTAAGGVVA
jgi:DNA-binding IclR family transcriptional regulator